MTTLYLMRHGFVDNPNNLFYGREFSLSERGKEQIRLLAQDMAQAGVKPQCMFASPFLRTRQTADIAAKILGVSCIEMDERLREWDVGSWFNRPIAEFYEATGYRADPPPDVLPTGIESLNTLADRVVDVVREIVDLHANKEILIVSHREPLVSALLALQGESLEKIHRVPFYRGMAWKADFDEKKNLISLAPAFDRSIDSW